MAIKNWEETLRNYEARLTNLTERGVQTGVLQERKRIADIINDEYVEAFPIDPTYAKKLFALLDKILETPNA